MSLDLCIESARRYNTKVSWSVSAPELYLKAFNEGWVDECCGHMRSPSSNAKWSLEICFEQAKQFQTRGDMRESAPLLYGAIQRNGWLDFCCSHMPGVRKHTLESTMAAASRYNTIKSWRTGSPRTYGAAVLNGWLEKCKTALLDYVAPPSREECIESARGHETISSWADECSLLYNFARRDRELYRECCAMITKYNIPFEECKRIALDYRTMYEWSRCDVRSYKSAKINNWLDECCGHMAKKKVKRVYTYDECRQISSKYKSRTDWKLSDRGSYSAALDNGWLDDFIVAYQGRGKPSFEECLSDARNYSTKAEWKRGSPQLHRRATNYGWFAECTKHMPKYAGSISLDECLESAKKYNFRDEWRLAERRLYLRAQRKGWLDKCCTHMGKRRRNNVKDRTITKAICLASVAKFQTMTDWSHRETKKYLAARKGGWLPECRARIGARL